MTSVFIAVAITFISMVSFLLIADRTPKEFYLSLFAFFTFCYVAFILYDFLKMKQGKAEMYDGIMELLIVLAISPLWLGCLIALGLIGVVHLSGRRSR